MHKQMRELILKKDKEVAAAMLRLSNLQETIAAERSGKKDINFVWEEKMREKEIGMQLLLKEVEETKEEMAYAKEKQQHAELREEAMRKKMRLIECELLEKIRLKEQEIKKLFEVIEFHKKETLKEIAKQKVIEDEWAAKLKAQEEAEIEKLAEKDELIEQL